ncbi:hypothetical protein GCM10025872_11320 [Barrientosiimonas endolithica]|uniref:Uncharacterized protein n=1 Tax=Barrientosiimonas endolithica TaxID=1535208 RepID=A0ABM8H973_9MICO|nr:hypothetical protein GCM10025872_11320 [Barrientosiimonas endolithica]
MREAYGGQTDRKNEDPTPETAQTRWPPRVRPVEMYATPQAARHAARDPTTGQRLRQARTLSTPSSSLPGADAARDPTTGQRLRQASITIGMIIGRRRSFPPT